MFNFKNNMEDFARLECLEEDKKNIKSRIESFRKEMEELELKVGLGTENFVKASALDLLDLENFCDEIELLEEQIRNIDKAIEKIKYKLNKRGKR